ncbi:MULTISPECIES: hypothetical protein [unclassified Bradyrhizobium]|uniref:hypothetical protein n=1 Tax=unclassified Bradyrhizobium TaxID=2631580 RepID=UPI001CD3CCE6|nr:MULTISPECIES: hypothetical protein [unclassified Bradyrhizobium]
MRHAVEMVSQQLSALNESSVKPDVIVLALPIPLIEKLVNATSEDAEPKEEDQEEDVAISCSISAIF